MAVNSETAINLKTLQRVDSNIIEIIDNASQVAIYKYERKLNKWECTDIEGTLFLYKRSLYPFHGFIIVNRMSTTNFVEAITNDMEFVQHEPYFLYKKSCGEIIGSWFYEQKDFRRITNKIQSIVLKQSTPPRRQRCSSDSDSQLKKDDVVQDIMSMLSEAHMEYIKAETSKPMLERNTEEFNNLFIHSNQELNNKSKKTCTDNSKKPSVLSSHAKYPASPRRRFLSTGSYDSSQQFPLPSNKMKTELIKQTKESSQTANGKKSKDESYHMNDVLLFPLSSENVENFPAPTRLSPLFSHEEISSPALSDLDIQLQPVKIPSRPNYLGLLSSNVVLKANSDDRYCKSDLDTKTENDIHSAVLKETLTTHMQFDSNIMLKIHEAYIESLKSMFALKKS